jgi:hypothetical protein
VAIRKTGCRRIVVNGITFLWRVPHRPARMAWDGSTGFLVAVQSEDRRGASLAIQFSRRHPKVALLWRSPVVSVVPSLVASAIRRALAAGWRPGEKGPGFAIAGEAPDAEPPAAAVGDGRICSEESRSLSAVAADSSRWPPKQ